jgi:hypothetical protein
MGAWEDRISQTVEKVTLSEAKALGFESTQGITKSGGMYHFSESLAPDRGGFQSVGIAKSGQTQMTPYYGDVTGAYRLTQEQFGSVYNPNDLSATSSAILRIMAENEAKAKGGIEPIITNQEQTNVASLRATPPSPSITQTISTFQAPPPVKTATLDIILFDDETVPVDQMADLILENIGGQELINIARSDTINGQKISYQPIKNLSSIQQRYNPNNILSLQQTADKYFAGFSIKLEDKIPNEGNGANGENIYIDEDTGDLIIELINLNPDEQIETQITVDGTIYEADLGEYTS